MKMPPKEENIWQRHLDVADEFIDKCVRPGLCKKNLSTNQDFIDHLYKWALESVCSTLFHKRIGKNQGGIRQKIIGRASTK